MIHLVDLVYKWMRTKSSWFIGLVARCDLWATQLEPRVRISSYDDIQMSIGHINYTGTDSLLKNKFL